jgi:hypothetical protein
MAQYMTVQRMWNFLIKLKRKSWIDDNNVTYSFLNEPAKDRFILIANHAHAKDPYVLGTILGTAIRYMANIEGVGSVSRALSGLVGAFGKRKGMPDLHSLKEALGYLKQREPVGVFPEGDRCWNGTTSDFDNAVLRMAKAVNASLLMARQEGSYLTFPRWADVPRKGSWHITFKTITAEEIKAANQNDLFKVIKDFLTVDDLSWAKKNSITFHCTEPARGITRVLWACPICGSCLSFKEQADSITCQTCKTVWTVDGNCNLKKIDQSTKPELLTNQIQHEDFPKSFLNLVSIKEWMDWQSQYIKRVKPLEDTAYPIERAQITEPGPEKLIGPGTIRLTNGTIVLTEQGNTTPFVFICKNIEGFVDNFNKHTAFTYESNRWKWYLGSTPHTLIQTYIETFTS